MQNASFPHMEWAKAHTLRPLRLELGFSGAAHPPGPGYREHGSGEPWLQARIAERHGVAPDQVYLAGGTSLANFVTIGAFCGPGTTVAVETPRYGSLAEIPRGLGADVVDLERPLKRIPRKASLAIVTSPHNPTGRLLREEEWAALGRFAGRGGVVLVDEVYRELQKRPPPVAARRHARFLTTGGVTKAFGLGALRLGWVLGAPALLDEVRRVDNLVSVQCATPSLRLLRRLWPRLDELRRRAMRPVARNLGTLRRSGLAFVEPEAGLTVFVHVGDGDAVAAALEEKGVGVARGSFFDAPEYVRLFLGADPVKFAEGVHTLRDQL